MLIIAEFDFCNKSILAIYRPKKAKKEKKYYFIISFKKCLE